MSLLRSFVLRCLRSINVSLLGADTDPTGWRCELCFRRYEADSRRKSAKFRKAFGLAPHFWISNRKRLIHNPPMISSSFATRSEFLAHYGHDARLRWSEMDQEEQREFVNQHIAGTSWLDWSTEAAAMELIQASLTNIGVGGVGRYDALILAGPVAELIEPAVLFQQATVPLKSPGRLIGIIPCLRDNSPESQWFAELAATTLWPYYTAEELIEMLAEAGWQIRREPSRFVSIRRYIEAVLKDQLSFKGFRRIFDQVEVQGYDPSEVGWGELRFVAEMT